MRLVRETLLGLALAAIAPTAIAGLSAQEVVPPRPGDAPPRAGESRVGSKELVKPSDADPGAKAQRAAEARQRTWDRKMKSVSGSICRGC